MPKANKYNVLLSNINIVNLLFGFGLVTSIFFSNNSKDLTTSITIPYRAFSLVISLSVLLINIRNFRRITKDAILLIIFYLAYIFRIFISTTFDFSAFNPGTDISMYYLSSIGIVFIPLLSILLSTQIISLSKILKWSFYISLITILLIIFKFNRISLAAVDERLNGNIALNTITLGHIGTSMFILSLSVFKFDKFHKVLAIPGIILGIYIAIISGSRSPLLALIIIILLWSLTFYSNKLISFLISGSFIISLFLLVNTYLNIIDDYSHASYSRIEASIKYGDTGERDGYFSAAIQQFTNSPILGDNFILKIGKGKGDYPHNLILEAMLAFGSLGGIVLFYLYFKSIRISYLNMKNNTDLKWVGFLFFQYLIIASLHGALWSSSQFLILMGIFLNFRSKRVNEKSQIKQNRMKRLTTENINFNVRNFRYNRN
jgi:hypothetical protein